MHIDDAVIGMGFFPEELEPRPLRSVGATGGDGDYAAGDANVQGGDLPAHELTEGTAPSGSNRGS